ncbi:MAG: molybdopterin molybdotransferase MoeA [Alphaproteobacteria bacterium]|nr:molybdopterin molybdotransferase MoeA [Alphaproteobacteria bacterium]
MAQRALSVDDALARILDGAGPTQTERVCLPQADGRTLAEPLVAKLTQPPFHASAMDGYAVRADDVATLPASLTLIGEAAAGHPYSGSPLALGQTVRIFTGAPLPEGADAIVIQENTERGEGNLVRVVDGTPDPGHVRPAGGDFLKGATGLEPGTRLMPRHIALAASMGHDTLPVRRKPVVAVIATGDELVEPGTPPGPGQIVASNGYAIAAMVNRAGGQAKLLGIARDTLPSLKSHLELAAGADILVTIGGASVGDHDLVAKALAAEGFELDFWKIAMRPGKPLMFAQNEIGQRAIGVPGNPVSSIICTAIFVLPLIAAMTGVRNAATTTELQASLTQSLAKNGPRQHYMRANLTLTADGKPTVTPASSQDSALLSILCEANALIVRQPNAPALGEGDKVTVRTIEF